MHRKNPVAAASPFQNILAAKIFWLPSRNIHIAWPLRDFAATSYYIANIWSGRWEPGSPDPGLFPCIDSVVSVFFMRKT